MYADAEIIHKSYPKFNLEGFRAQLQRVAFKFDDDTRNASRGMSEKIRALNSFFGEMENLSNSNFYY